MPLYNSILLDQSKWDMVIDSAGNIAMATPPYSLAQDVSSAIKLFLGELWYNRSKGIPYFEEILGQLPPTSVIIGYIEKAAMTVPGVVNARCNITGFSNREIQGILQFIDENSVTHEVKF